MQLWKGAVKPLYSWGYSPSCEQMNQCVPLTHPLAFSGPSSEQPAGQMSGLAALTPPQPLHQTHQSPLLQPSELDFEPEWGFSLSGPRKDYLRRFHCISSFLKSDFPQCFAPSAVLSNRTVFLCYFVYFYVILCYFAPFSSLASAPQGCSGRLMEDAIYTQTSSRKTRALIGPGVQWPHQTPAPSCLFHVITSLSMAACSVC